MIAGREAAAGKYLCYLTPDILVAPTFFDKAFLFLQLHQAFFFVNAYLVNVNEQVVNKQISNIGLIRRSLIDHLIIDSEELNPWINLLKVRNDVIKGFTIPELLFHSKKTTAINGEYLEKDTISIKRNIAYSSTNFNPFFLYCPLNKYNKFGGKASFKAFTLYFAMA
ncbi:MAG: hypothetical protein WDO19_10035 [Bacteroidota bacterium]